jgi:hypothetical protein
MCDAPVAQSRVLVVSQVSAVFNFVPVDNSLQTNFGETSKIGVTCRLFMDSIRM